MPEAATQRPVYTEVLSQSHSWFPHHPSSNPLTARSALVDWCVNPRADGLAQVSAASGDVGYLNTHHQNSVIDQTQLIHMICIKHKDRWLQGRIVCIAIGLPWHQDDANPLIHQSLVHPCFVLAGVLTCSRVCHKFTLLIVTIPLTLVDKKWRPIYHLQLLQQRVWHASCRYLRINLGLSWCL